MSTPPPTDVPEGPESHCELSFSPNVSLIGTVRRFVGEFYVRVLNDTNITSRLVVATHELLENAVRYSADGQSSIRIGVRRVGDSVKATIETRNKTMQANQAELSALLEEMRTTQDRLSFYQVLMKRSSKRQDGSGLGLGRIHAESEMDLSCELEGDIVKLRAEARFLLKGAQ
jgi:anti-sigma regulatory factor (Ser/Thr protein kinase)